MNEQEIQFFNQQLCNCYNYLEFGSGNSTLLAIKTPSIRNIVSTEADLDF